MSFLKNINEVSLAGVAFKNMTLKKSIIRYLDVHENALNLPRPMWFNKASAKMLRAELWVHKKSTFRGGVSFMRVPLNQQVLQMSSGLTSQTSP